MLKSWADIAAKPVKTESNHEATKKKSAEQVSKVVVVGEKLTSVGDQVDPEGFKVVLNKKERKATRIVSGKDIAEAIIEVIKEIPAEQVAEDIQQAPEVCHVQELQQQVLLKPEPKEDDTAKKSGELVQESVQVYVVGTYESGPVRTKVAIQPQIQSQVQEVVVKERGSKAREVSVMEEENEAKSVGDKVDGDGFKVVQSKKDRKRTRTVSLKAIEEATKLETEKMESGKEEKRSDADVKGTEDDTAMPLGMEDETEMPLGMVDGTVMPLQLEDDTAMPLSMEDGTVVTLGMEDNIAMLLGMEDGTVMPLGMEDVTAMPLGMEDGTVMPIGMKDDTAMPLGMEDDRAMSLGMEDETTMPLGLEDGTVMPLGMEDDTVMPLGMEDGTTTSKMNFTNQGFPVLPNSNEYDETQLSDDQLKAIHCLEQNKQIKALEKEKVKFFGLEEPNDRECDLRSLRTSLGAEIENAKEEFKEEKEEENDEREELERLRGSREPVSLKKRFFSTIGKLNLRGQGINAVGTIL